jgi:hypothetical protein
MEEAVLCFWSGLTREQREDHRRAVALGNGGQVLILAIAHLAAYGSIADLVGGHGTGPPGDR